jgi:pyruvate dehydrogenase E2 component (dihydrolipoamide acetyltransferase)
MTIFRVPDLGEGLTEVEIRAWHVKPGDEVAPDQPLLEVETAKAVVDIPSPQRGRIARLHGAAGDIVHVGDPLVEFAGESADAGTVVGQLGTARQVVHEAPAAVAPEAAAGLKATPAVRALAHRLNVDLAAITPSGPDGTITAADVERVARAFAEAGPLEPLRGARRAMARAMAQAHAEVVAVTVSDDADIERWRADEDVTVRLVRAIVVACRAVPALNAWYDGHAMGRRLLEPIHLAIAVDTDEGLFVPVLRDVAHLDRQQLRAALDEIKAKVRARRLTPEDLRGGSFTLSNFGTFGGRYADPVIIPPSVAILGAGKVRPAVVVTQDGRFEAHRLLPLSLSFDHRAVTGGEATRFLAAAIADLERNE